MSERFIGAIILFGGNFAPRGWALCDGQILLISQNSALFSLLGTTYGGDGETTFALPDLRGRTPIGPELGPGLTRRTLGQKAGTENVTLSEAGQVILSIIDDFETPVSSVTCTVFTPDRKRVSTGSRSPRSDGRGQMTIENLPHGSYLVLLRRSGMISREIPVDVRSGETTRMNVQLEHVKK